MFCRKCGSQLGDDAAFCHKCGTPPVILEECRSPRWMTEIVPNRMTA